MKYHWMFWKRNVWKLIVVKNDLIERKLPMLTVSFFFFAFKTKIFVYTCSNRPNEVSIEFLWLYVITVDIYICEICLLFLLTSCFSLWRVCECHIILLYLKKTQHLINMIVFFIIIQHIHNNNDSNHATNVNFVH